MKILLVQDSSAGEALDRITFSLESSFDADVRTVDNLEDALIILTDQSTKLDLLIIDYQKGTTGQLEDFYTIASKFPNIFCFKVGGKQPPLDWNILALVDRASLIANLLKAIEKLVASGKLNATLDAQAYCKIRTKLLIPVVPLKGDIYIKLSAAKFVKLFNEGDQFEPVDLEKYTVKKGIEHLHIQKKDVKEFIDKYSSDLDKQLRGASISIEEVASISDSIYDTVQELGRQLGFKRDVQDMTKAHMRLTVKAMGKSPTLAAVLERLESFKGNYIAAHSTLCGFLSCEIASQMEWASDATFQKLTLASFLHDITLENAELAQCTSVEEVKKGPFTEVEKLDFQQHPMKCAEIARKFQEVPPDVDQIIVQHHEKPDGSGFPRKITHSHISPLACVFMVGHDLADIAIREGQSFDFKKAIAQIADRYTSSQFRRILSAVGNL
ncbi:MAG: HD-GYP domain-containing protein [Bdellovibrionota bacterium]